MSRSPKAAPRFFFVVLLGVLVLASCLTELGEGEVDGGEILPPSTSSPMVVESAPLSLLKVEPPPFVTGEVLKADELFKGNSEFDRAVLKSNPRFHLGSDFDAQRDTTLVIGLPGWGGRSENFVWILVNGLEQKGSNRNLVVASIQDTRHGGPQYQGQGTRKHANTWWVNAWSVEVMGHFISRLTERLGTKKTDVFFVGYSTGGVSAPIVASRLPDGATYHVAGAVSVGTATGANATLLKDRGQRVLFIVVPPWRPGDGKPLRDDQWNRQQAEKSVDRLTDRGVTAYLRHIPSARRHVDWHWGLISQCRFFPGKRIDNGRGYWPNYWMPNPQTIEVLSAFIRGNEPPTPSRNYLPAVCPN